MKVKKLFQKVKNSIFPSYALGTVWFYLGEGRDLESYMGLIVKKGLDFAEVEWAFQREVSLVKEKSLSKK